MPSSMHLHGVRTVAPQQQRLFFKRVLPAAAAVVAARPRPLEGRDVAAGMRSVTSSSHKIGLASGVSR